MGKHVNVAACIVSACVLGSAWPAAAQNAAGSAPSALKVIELLEATGMNYEKRSPTSWMVRYEGTGGADIPVVLAQADSILVLVAIAAAGSEIRQSTDLFRDLLTFNIDADYIKAGIDDDGDYQIRADVKLVTLTADLLKELMDQVATGVNQLRPLFAKHKK